MTFKKTSKSSAQTRRSLNEESQVAAFSEIVFYRASNFKPKLSLVKAVEENSAHISRVFFHSFVF